MKQKPHDNNFEKTYDTLFLIYKWGKQQILW